MSRFVLSHNHNYCEPEPNLKLSLHTEMTNIYFMGLWRRSACEVEAGSHSTVLVQIHVHTAETGPSASPCWHIGADISDPIIWSVEVFHRRCSP